MHLFAGIQVTSYAAAVECTNGSSVRRRHASLPTSRRCGRSFEHQYVFIEQRPEHAGHARHLVFVDDLDALVAPTAERGLTPA